MNTINEDATSPTETVNMEEGLIDEAIPAPSNNGTTVREGRPNRRLTACSKMYDVDGDGKLNEVEQAMRNLDKSGRGFLTNDKVYNLMNEMLMLQKNMFTMKKVVFGLFGLIVVLALANLGTSYATAILSKDTSTDTHSNMIVKSTGLTVGTQMTADVYESQQPSETTARKLCTINGQEADCSATSFTEMVKEDALALLQSCASDRLVRLSIVHNGGEIRKTVCNPNWTCDLSLQGPKTKPTSGALCIEGSTEIVYIQPNPGDRTKYSVSGNAGQVESSDYLNMCYSNDDCQGGEECSYNPPPQTDASVPQPSTCTSDSDCTDGYCVTSPIDDKSMVCSPCNPSNNEGCSGDSHPTCIANGGGGFTCGCNAKATNPCSSGLTCGSAICIPDELPYCSATDHSYARGCGTCAPPARK